MADPDDLKRHPALKGYLQQHRDEAYKGGWDDGYAEGYGKARADVGVAGWRQGAEPDDEAEWVEGGGDGLVMPRVGSPVAGMETTTEERAGLMPRLRTGLMAVAAFVRGTVDMEPRMNDALDALDVVEKVLRDIDRQLIGSLSPSPSLVAGMETTAEDMRILRLTLDPARVGRLLRDIDRQSAEIARLTAALAQEKDDLRTMTLHANALSDKGRAAREERDYNRTAHDSAIKRIAELTKSLREEREACARVAEALPGDIHLLPTLIAAAIRARSTGDKT